MKALILLVGTAGYAGGHGDSAGHDVVTGDTVDQDGTGGGCERSGIGTCTVWLPALDTFRPFAIQLAV